MNNHSTTSDGRKAMLPLLLLLLMQRCSCMGDTCGLPRVAADAAATTSAKLFSGHRCDHKVAAAVCQQ